MSKGKEALASRNAEIKNLQSTIIEMDKEIKRLIQIEKNLLKENKQLNSYKERMKVVADATIHAAKLKEHNDYLMKEVAIWKVRATILAEADRDNEESMFSKESIEVLADMDMLPKAIIPNRYAARKAKSGAKVTKQWQMVETALDDLKAQGIKGVLKNV